MVLRVSGGQLGRYFLAFELNDSRIPRGHQHRRGPLKYFPVFRGLDQAIVGFDNGLTVNSVIIHLPTVTLRVNPDGLSIPLPNMDVRKVAFSPNSQWLVAGDTESYTVVLGAG